MLPVNENKFLISIVTDINLTTLEVRIAFSVRGGIIDITIKKDTATFMVDGKPSISVSLDSQMFAPGQTYVALSRCTEWSKVHIASLHPSAFIISQFSVRYWKVANGSLSSSVQNRKGNGSLNSSVRNGRENILRALQSGLEGENEMLSNGSFSFLVDSPSVRALGIRKRFLDFISGMEDQIRLWEFRIRKETFGSGNSESEKKHSALEMEMEM
ncbi:hypothetical protein C1645_882001 [Glomus cerebriforme]|uniref:Uncharacterized protein n=1 Tax=Glomus cerebriforme TaxID=658196 RepID=A0A397S7I3_9GLOM|nr:hypothetical protein C1645_882001 [Glomus cerebriforme]